MVYLVWLPSFEACSTRWVGLLVAHLCVQGGSIETRAMHRERKLVGVDSSIGVVLVISESRYLSWLCIYT
jgi:hypothetical protein